MPKKIMTIREFIQYLEGVAGEHGETNEIYIIGHDGREDAPSVSAEPHENGTTRFRIM